MRIALHTCNRTETQRLAQLLEAAGAHCSCFATAQAAMQTVHHGGFDVAVIDARAHRDPDEAMLAWMRCRAAATGLVMLTAECNTRHDRAHAGRGRG